ncbi:MAG: DUF5916 domain-containing protein [Bacteroidota bacterium]
MYFQLKCIAFQLLLFSLLICFIFQNGQAQQVQVFPPPEQPLEIYATKVLEESIEIDGVLDEGAWQLAEAVMGFTQRDPFQGKAASGDTEVRILYDSKFLYIGAINKDSLSDRKNVRVRNMQRDFSGYGNDRFSVALDGLLDKRNAVGFEVTPYGSQRETQVIDGDEFDGNDNWDALWYVRTQITDTAWIAEVAIPWKTLRYREGAKEMYISFNRNIRRLNEVNTWPSYPRVFSHFRMAYAAVLKGIEPPPPSANLQINPYVLGDLGRTKEGDQPEEEFGAAKIGGEVKWAITPNAVLDATINTDFAQADVDQQVQNLSRVSVLFPERRQFFLENANIFSTSSATFIQPFFSRRIGLDDDGSPIPLDGGLRFTSQTSKQTSGILAMRQRATENSPASYFGVGRYVQNFSGQNRLGGMITHRRDDAFEQNGITTAQRNNTTATVNGFLRPKQSLSMEAMVTASADSETGNGLAAHAWIWQQKNWGYLGVIGQYAGQNYLPGVGLLRLTDYALLSPTADFDFRPKWLPNFVRSFGPDVNADLIWRASDGAFQQGILNIAPIDLEWQTGGEFEVRITQEWQQLDESFRPLGITIDPGSYQFTRVDFGLSSDFSKKIAGGIRYETGGYYNGQQDRWLAEVRLSPTPYVEFTGFYVHNRFRGLGELKTDFNTDLIVARTRLALNPRVQLIGSYQWNSANQTDIWNVRFAWEYRPLSFIYLVFNSNQRDDFVPRNRFSSEELIAKMTYLRQF